MSVSASVTSVDQNRSMGGRTDNPPVPQPSDARLGLLVGEQRWLLDLSQAGEIVPIPEAIVPVPLTRDWLMGLVNLRGALYTVVDLRRFAGMGRTEPGKESRLLPFSPRLHVNAAILVTRMLGLRNLTAMRPVEAPQEPDRALGGRRFDWIGATWMDADGHVWRELDLARLATSSEFLMVGR